MEQEDDGRDAVDDHGQHGAQAAGVGQREGEREAEDGEEHDAHRGTEIAAVDGGREHPGHQQHRPRARVGGSTIEGASQRRLDGEERRGPEDEPGHDPVEGGRRRREEQQRARDAAGQGDGGEADQPPRLVADLAAVAGRRGDVARPDPDGVGDVGGERRIAEGQQDRERDQAAAAGHAVEDAGPQARQDDQHDVGGGHGAPEYGTTTVGFRRERSRACRARTIRPRSEGNFADRRKVGPLPPFRPRREESRRVGGGAGQGKRCEVGSESPPWATRRSFVGSIPSPAPTAAGGRSNRETSSGRAVARHRAGPSGPPPFPLRSRGRPGGGRGAAAVVGGKQGNRRCGPPGTGRRNPVPGGAAGRPNVPAWSGSPVCCAARTG